MVGRRTKIIATLGPASCTAEQIRRLHEAGMDVARLNFSHGGHEWHDRAIPAVRSVSDRIGILQDLQGPRIRTGPLRGGGPVALEAGAEVTLTTRTVAGTAQVVSVTYDRLPAEVRRGMTILISDGLLQLLVESTESDVVRCRVVVGGPLREHQGINVPEAAFSLCPFTEKDRRDLMFGIAHEVDFVALSFVKSAEDIARVRRVARESGASPTIIAKIERREAVENLDEILEASDGVMVARGDLGLETSSADVPIIQKRIINASNSHSKVDITATQMLESMTRNPRPTRAEACDIANAVFDGTDALMLSAETAVGRYPVEAVRTMAEIAARAEEELADFGRPFREHGTRPPDVARATAQAACLAARELDARAIVVLTESGHSALLVAQRRPSVPVLALTPHPATVRRLALAWGVEADLYPRPQRLDDAVEGLEAKLLATGTARRGDLVVVTAGSSMLPGATNTVRIVRIGETRRDSAKEAQG